MLADQIIGRDLSEGPHPRDKKRGLPAFVPRSRGVNSLDPEDRNSERQKENDDYGDYEVTGFMCDSDGDADCVILENFSRETYLVFSAALGPPTGALDSFVGATTCAAFARRRGRLPPSSWIRPGLSSPLLMR